MRRNLVVLAFALLVNAAVSSPLRAQDAPPPAPEPAPPEKWFDTADFSFVYTAGNSQTSTLGFKNKLWRKWTSSRFEMNAGGVRQDSTTITYEAFGSSPSDFYVEKNEDSALKAEAYYVNGRYDQDLSEDWYWFAGGGWDRNTFAGIANRYTAFGGVGTIWINEPEIKFRTDYGLTFTKQNDVVVNPDSDDNFFGARFSWLYWHKFTESTIYGNDLVIDENLDETSDFRVDMTNWVSVSINKTLALKVSLQWLYDNRPSLVEVPLFDDTQLGPPFPRIGTVTTELESLDTIFTASLVVNF